MSREARQLRDNVYETCAKYYSHGDMGLTSKFESTIIDTYDPVVWERPILYAQEQVVFDAFMRVTSDIYQKQQRDGREAKGNKAGSRRKDIDWLQVVTTFPDDLWVPNINEQTRRSRGAIEPSAFDRVRNQFTPMYGLFSQWLIVDFSHKVLFGIYDISLRYSLDLVKECMDMVTELRNRSYEYVAAIIEKEMVVRQAEMLENKELNDRSKAVLKVISDLALNKTKSLDWESLEKNVKIDRENQEAFNKVKPT